MRSFDQLSHRSSDYRLVSWDSFCQQSVGKLTPSIGDRQSESRECAGKARNHYSADPQRFSQIASMDAAGAAKCDQGEVRGIVATLKRDVPERSGHLSVHDVDDAGCRLRFRHAKFRGKRFKSLLDPIAIKRNGSSEDGRLRYASEQ